MSDTTPAEDDLGPSVARLLHDYPMEEILSALADRAQWYATQPWQIREHVAYWHRVKTFLRSMRDIFECLP